MKLDLKSRLRNPYFWSGLISVIFLLCKELGIILPDGLEGKVGQAFDGLAYILVMLGVFVNPTTEGLSDE